MQIIYWGTRGSIPAPGKDTIKYGGNTTCVEVVFDDGKRIILDAGTGIRPLGIKLVKSSPSVIDLFITHTHWDHIQGLPFFIPIYIKSESIRIYGCSPTYEKLEKLLANQMIHDYFPVRFEDLPAHIEFKRVNPDGFKLGNVEVYAIQTNHPLTTHSFCFKVGRIGGQIPFLANAK